MSEVAAARLGNSRAYTFTKTQGNKPASANHTGKLLTFPFTLIVTDNFMWCNLPRITVLCTKTRCRAPAFVSGNVHATDCPPPLPPTCADRLSCHPHPCVPVCSPTPESPPSGVGPVAGAGDNTWPLLLKASGSVARAPLGFDHSCT